VTVASARLYVNLHLDSDT